MSRIFYVSEEPFDTLSLYTRLSKCVVSYQYDTTRHMCLVKETTQKDTQKKIFFPGVVKKIFPND